MQHCLLRPVATSADGAVLPVVDDLAYNIFFAQQSFFIVKELREGCAAWVIYIVGDTTQLTYLFGFDAAVAFVCSYASITGE